MFEQHSLSNLIAISQVATTDKSEVIRLTIDGQDAALAWCHAAWFDLHAASMYALKIALGRDGAKRVEIWRRWRGGGNVDREMLAVYTRD